jgi:hypothetical protein
VKSKGIILAEERNFQRGFGRRPLTKKQHSKIVLTFKVSFDLKLKIVLTSNLKQKNGFIEFK